MFAERSQSNSITFSLKFDISFLVIISILLYSNILENLYPELASYFKNVQQSVASSIYKYCLFLPTDQPFKPGRLACFTSQKSIPFPINTGFVLVGFYFKKIIFASIFCIFVRICLNITTLKSISNIL